MVETFIALPTFLPQVPDEVQLYDAADGKRWKECLYILKSNPKINLQYRDDEYGGTALHRVCLHGGVEVCKMMVEGKTVEINARVNAGWTPLVLAICNNQIEIIPILLAKGAIANNYIQTEDGRWSRKS